MRCSARGCCGGCGRSSIGVTRTQRHGHARTWLPAAAVAPPAARAHQLNTAGRVARPTTCPRPSGMPSDSICGAVKRCGESSGGAVRGSVRCASCACRTHRAAPSAKQRGLWRPQAPTHTRTSGPLRMRRGTSRTPAAMTSPRPIVAVCVLASCVCLRGGGVGNEGNDVQNGRRRVVGFKRAARIAVTRVAMSSTPRFVRLPS